MKPTRLIVLLALIILREPMQFQWVQTNGPYGGYVRTLATLGTYLFAGTPGGVFRSTDSGMSWTPASAGLPVNNRVNSFVISETILFCGTDGGVFLSTDYGTHWSAANTEITSPGVLCLAVSGTNLYASTSTGIALSSNNGSSWTPINNGLTYFHFSDLVASGTNILAGTMLGPGTYRSTDNGAHWTLVPSIGSVLRFALDGADLFAIEDNSPYVIHSTDSGLTWSAIDSGLTGNGFRSITAAGANLLLGTQDGNVFRSIALG